MGGPRKKPQESYSATLLHPLEWKWMTILLSKSRTSYQHCCNCSQRFELWHWMPLCHEGSPYGCHHSIANIEQEVGMSSWNLISLARLLFKPMNCHSFSFHCLKNSIYWCSSSQIVLVPTLTVSPVTTIPAWGMLQWCRLWWKCRKQLPLTWWWPMTGS
jgi:hypothetical protein